MRHRKAFGTAGIPLFSRSKRTLGRTAPCVARDREHMEWRGLRQHSRKQEHRLAAKSGGLFCQSKGSEKVTVLEAMDWSPLQPP